MTPSSKEDGRKCVFEAESFAVHMNNRALETGELTRTGSRSELGGIVVYLKTFSLKSNLYCFGEISEV